LGRLVADRREIGAAGLLVEAEGHHVEDEEDPQAVAKAPAEQVPVVERDDEARGAEVLGGADERLEVVVRLGDRVAEVVDAGRVGREPAGRGR
jgi:hypothetical protein